MTNPALDSTHFGAGFRLNSSTERPPTPYHTYARPHHLRARLRASSRAGARAHTRPTTESCDHARRNDEQQLRATLPSTPRGSPSSELEGAAGKVVPAKSQPPPPSLVAQASASVLTNIPIIAAVSALGYLLTMALAGMTGPVAGGVKLIYAGAIAGIISRTCCAPLEMVSTVMMCRGDECTSMWDELQKTWKKEGLTGLFRGNVANCLKVAPSRGTQFLVYEFAKRQLALLGWGLAASGSLNAGARLCAGGLAGMVAAVIVYPLEVIKTLRTVCRTSARG